MLAASFEEFDLEGIIGSYQKGADIWHLSKEELGGLKEKADHLVMTDDYVPVENMLAPGSNENPFLLNEVTHPPGCQCFSSMSVFTPAFARVTAAPRPPAPLPIIQTSYFFSGILFSLPLLELKY